MVRLLSGRRYRLPTGLALTARQAVQNNVFDLFTDSNLLWNPREAVYRAQANGMITYMGKATQWNTGDLLDTGVDVPQLAAGA